MQKDEVLAGGEAPILSMTLHYLVTNINFVAVIYEFADCMTTFISCKHLKASGIHQTTSHQ